MRRTKIIATLGPACGDEEGIQRLLRQSILSEGGRAAGTKDLWWHSDLPEFDAARYAAGDPSLRSG